MCIDGHFIKVKKKKNTNTSIQKQRKKEEEEEEEEEEVNMLIIEEEKIKGKIKWRRRSQHVGDLEVNSKGIFGSSFHEFPLPSFLSILERKFFDGPEEKISRLHYLFSFFSTQPNTL